MSSARIARVERARVSAYRVPTDAPESDGTLAWDSTVIVTVELACDGVVGLGYTYADASTAKLIETLLAGIAVGHPAMDTAACFTKMVVAVRNLGRAGIASMAISAVDVAMWDLKAKLLGLPLVSLLGTARAGVPVYGSGGFTSYDVPRLERQLGEWVASGIGRVKMKIGVSSDTIDRVRAARMAIGDDAELFVDANGAYDVKRAQALAAAFAALDVTWFEEPVSSDDLAGLHSVRERAPASMEIAAGEYGYDSRYFTQLFSAGAVDVAQADATRCGGVTGFMDVAALCDAHSMPLSCHCAPALHAALGCSSRRVRHLEYFHDHVRIERLFFDGVLEPDGGRLVPDTSRTGLGLSLRSGETKPYAIGHASHPGEWR